MTYLKHEFAWAGGNSEGLLTLSSSCAGLPFLIKGTSRGISASGGDLQNLAHSILQNKIRNKGDKI